VGQDLVEEEASGVGVVVEAGRGFSLVKSCLASEVNPGGDEEGGWPPPILALFFFSRKAIECLLG